MRESTEDVGGSRWGWLNYIVHKGWFACVEWLFYPNKMNQPLEGANRSSSHRGILTSTPSTPWDTRQTPFEIVFEAYVRVTSPTNTFLVTLSQSSHSTVFHLKSPLHLNLLSAFI
ncbi:hypothetical protein PV326_008876 [Microctonus aethiopoides]|nr:hypothetical protein PV326_008876 [Microctonus aethiopoides]